MHISIDIGGTAIKYGLIATDGQFVHKDKRDTEAFLGGKAIIEKIIQIINTYIKKNMISGVSISTAGIVDSEEGAIIYSGKQIPNYIGVNWKQIIWDEFELECEVENDANCAGLAEAISGNGKEYNKVLCLTIGTGIGASFVNKKEIYHGGSFAACEVGHMHMRDSTFQDLAATTVLINKIAKEKKISPDRITGEDIFRMAKNGDAICNREIDSMIDHLAYGISNICFVLNPDIIILGGGIMQQRDFLYEKMTSSLNLYLNIGVFKNTKLKFAKHSNDSGMIGAYYNYLLRNGVKLKDNEVFKSNFM